MRLSREQLAATAQAVAEFLPEDWIYAGDPNFPGAIDGPDGAQILLTQRVGKGGGVSGQLPNTYRVCWVSDEDRAKASIGVTLTRPPAQIAREITRRLLPGYLPLYRELLERVRSNEEFTRRRDALAKRIKSQCPNAPRIVVEPYSDDMVKFTARLTAAEAEAVCAALADLED